MGIVLIGMTNIGDVDCMIHTVEASFRHPEDYSVVIQNVKENNFKEREIKVMEKKEKVEKKKKKSSPHTSTVFKLSLENKQPSATDGQFMNYTSQLILDSLLLLHSRTR